MFDLIHSLKFHTSETCWKITDRLDKTRNQLFHREDMILRRIHDALPFPSTIVEWVKGQFMNVAFTLAPECCAKCSSYPCMCERNAQYEREREEYLRGVALLPEDELTLIVENQGSFDAEEFARSKEIFLAEKTKFNALDYRMEGFLGFRLQEISYEAWEAIVHETDNYVLEPRDSPPYDD